MKNKQKKRAKFWRRQVTAKKLLIAACIIAVPFVSIADGPSMCAFSESNSYWDAPFGIGEGCAPDKCPYGATKIDEKCYTNLQGDCCKCLKWQQDCGSGNEYRFSTLIMENWTCQNSEDCVSGL
jgi:hypothetical protein